MLTLVPEQICNFVRGAQFAAVQDQTLVLHRIDQRFAARFPSEFFSIVEKQGAGPRLEFSTTSTSVTLVVESQRTQVLGGPIDPLHPFELTVDGTVFASTTGNNFGTVMLDPLSGRAEWNRGNKFSLDFSDLPAGQKNVAIWFPYDEITRVHSLTTPEPIWPVAETTKPRWVHYGSSISHGACADSSLGAWPVLAADHLGLELINLGMSGNAVLDPFVARVIAESTADLISLKVGINIVNSDCFTARSIGPAMHGFLDIIRQAQPKTPILLITALTCPLIERLPGPTELDPRVTDRPLFRTAGTFQDLAVGKLSLQLIRQQIEQVAAVRDDTALRIISGLDLLGPADLLIQPLPDNIHPNPLHHSLIADRFADRVIELGLVSHA